MVQTCNTKIKIWKMWSDLLVIWLSIIGSLVGGSYALFQYVQNSDAERAKETLKFVERFDKDRLYESRQKVDAAIDEMGAGLMENIAKGDSHYLSYLTEGINRSKTSYHLNQIFDFYDQLHACVEAKLCETDIADRFFGKYAYDLVGTIYPYIQQRKVDDVDEFYASGIEYFFVRYRDQRAKLSRKLKAGWLDLDGRKWAHCTYSGALPSRQTPCRSSLDFATPRGCVCVMFASIG